MMDVTFCSTHRQDARNVITVISVMQSIVIAIILVIVPISIIIVYAIIDYVIIGW